MMYPLPPASACTHRPVSTSVSRPTSDSWTSGVCWNSGCGLTHQKTALSKSNTIDHQHTPYSSLTHSPLSLSGRVLLLTLSSVVAVQSYVGVVRRVVGVVDY